MNRFCVVGLACAFALLIASSCGTLRKSTSKVARALGITQDIYDVPLPGAPEEYKRALALLQDRRFEEALAILEEFIREEPASHYAQAAALNAGRALEGLGRWTEAGERYRSVAVACDRIAPKLQSMALYRLSFCHEALADDPATVAVLRDLLGRVTQLPDEIGRAELPARIAAAYARVGNFEEAIKYYANAESGIIQLKRRHGSDVPQWLPRTLYFMGSMSVRRVTWDDFETALRPLGRGQSYLLQSAELGMSPWSDRAAQDLMTTYQGLWNTLQAAPFPPSSDPIVSRRQVQERQWDRASLVLEKLTELRARFFKDPSEQSKGIASFSADLEKEIRKLLEQRPAGEGLTPESMNRRRRLRGQVIAPDNSLERRYLESTKPTLPATQLPDKTVSPPPQDPNL